MNLRNKHNKKSEYYTSAEGYRDMDGNQKQFTFVDHDVKLSKSFSKPMKEDELKQLKQSMEEGKKRKVEEILSLPAVNVIRNGGADIYEPFVTRDREEGVSWNKIVLTGACMLDAQLARNIWTILWKNTVKEQYWWDDLTHEEIIAGKWKDLT